ncbi:MAG: 4-hydroxy-tetrahydrodipicolinate synthase [Moraxellaceae bacterium]|nr:4-hydroxy-tetrahydrodipicolinate synthase [Pseudobdellovibrionaceae bacterium]
MSLTLKGVFSALITPFENGEVDYTSLEKLVDYQVSQGINGLVINGTTAESPTLTPNEVKKIFSIVRAMVGLQFPLILGTGSNSTAKSMEDTQKAAELGADAALVVVPYYNKPPQRGLVQHYKAIAKNSEIPVIMYNVPGRTITSMTAETIWELSEIKNILGIKEASGDIVFDERIKSKLPNDFVFLSGDDGTYIDFLKLGGHGIISVMSNIIPKLTVEWTQAVMNGSVKETEIAFNKFKALIDGMYIEANPIPVKWMLHRKGLIKSPEMRLPLMELHPKYRATTEKLMLDVGLL